MKQTDYLVGNLKIIEDLKKMPVFEPFTREELTMLLNMSKLRRYSPGETIIQEGNIDRWVYFLVNGKVSYNFVVPDSDMDYQVYLAVENITDTEYEQKKSYPMPDLSCMLGFVIKFN